MKTITEITNEVSKLFTSEKFDTEGKRIVAFLPDVKRAIAELGENATVEEIADRVMIFRRERIRKLLSGIKFPSFRNFK